MTADEILSYGRWIRAGAGLGALAADGVRPAPEALSDPALGTPIATAPTTWTRRLEAGGRTVYLKTYDYPSARDRLRGALRTTWLAPSRAAREWDALCWLRAHGFDSAEPLGVGEWRGRAGWLRRALLVTAAWPGEPLTTVLPGLPAEERAELLVALDRWVTALHAAGFRDRNLDPRNILVRRDAERLRFAKIDSPRHRLRGAGSRCDRLVRADRDRLARGLRELLGAPAPAASAGEP
ncbi:MAG: hypothetical protein IPM29_10945 [Planctomycetes bacterium]|nr:hypothetical protein [Planctomycetota bacterium]